MTVIHITGDATGDLEGIILSCLKQMKKRGTFVVPDNLMRKILMNALKGNSCRSCHLDIAHRHSLYEYLKDKDDVDAYIQSFLKESKEIVKWI